MGAGPSRLPKKEGFLVDQTEPATGFLLGDIASIKLLSFVGRRMENNAWRHFLNQVAFVVVAPLITTA